MLIRFAQYVLCQFLAVGQLSIALGDEPMHPIAPSTAEPQAAICLTHRRVLWRLMLHPDLAFGESYMDWDLQIESGDIDDLMALLVANRISFALRDYRNQTGRFDKIVSVGTLEHVRAKHYDSYFASIMTTSLFVCGNSILLVVCIFSGHKLV